MCTVCLVQGRLRAEDGEGKIAGFVDFTLQDLTESLC